jgi:hypothetical protein
MLAGPGLFPPKSFDISVKIAYGYVKVKQNLPFSLTNKLILAAGIMGSMVLPAVL